MFPHLLVFYWTTLLICSTYYAYNIPEISLLEESPMDSMVDFNRIVGGDEAKIEDYPHQGSMVINDTYFCGCFILSEYWIVTAAHCVQNADPSNLVVRAGSRWRENGTIIPIAEVRIHSEYNKPISNNNIALLRTPEPINFTGIVKPISLPPTDRLLEADSYVIVTGWGKTNQNAISFSNKLMAIEIQVMSELECFLYYPYIYTENMFCAGNFFGGKGTCQGDSGGAVIQDDMLVGIVSYDSGCGQPLSPSLFTDIQASSIRGFIAVHTGF